MNYISQIRAFYDALSVKQLSAGQIALWHALMDKCNRCGWPEWFTVANIMLESSCSLSRKGIFDSRNSLKQAGLIEFRSNGTKATSYHIIKLYSTQDSTQVTTQATTQDSTQVSATLLKPKTNKQNIRTKGTSLSDESDEPKPPKKIFADDSTEMQLSALLLTLMRQNNPSCKEPNLQGWCRHIDLMLRVDKRTPEQIKGVIAFSQKDAFWRANILSTSKLREKFDQLYMKSQSLGPSKVTTGGASRVLRDDI